MSYHKRVLIFLTTMAATAVVLVAFFVHFTLREIGSLKGSFVPLPTFSAEDQEVLQTILHKSLNTSSPQQSSGATDMTPSTTPTPQVQNTPTSPPNNGIPASDALQEIPAKAIQ